jgi:hypothetical protein
MRTDDNSPRPGPGGAEYYYRRRIAGGDLLPAIGIGVGVGLAAFYVARLLQQRTPLVPPGRNRPRDQRLVRDREGLGEAPTE